MLLHAPSPRGGLAEHDYYQGEALQKLGARVVCLTCPSFLDGRNTNFETRRQLPDPVAPGKSGFARRVRLAWRIIACQLLLAREILRLMPDLVLLESYVEYLSPVWVWPHLLLARVLGIRYAANLHDPVRGYAVGPRRWHELSVRLAYRPIQMVLVHNPPPPEARIPACVRIIEVPVGVYEIRSSGRAAEEVRRGWTIGPGQKVFLAFGFVRDDKNLDLVVRALAGVPLACLVIAGSVASAKDKTFADYKKLAREHGVGDRCAFHEGFIADGELGDYFAGTDFVLLTYASSFHSQSGVLNLAARARKPVLASAAPGPLVDAVRQFNLGVTVSPDSAPAIAGGMKQLLAGVPEPDWSGYEGAAAWETNASRLLAGAGIASAIQVNA